MSPSPEIDVDQFIGGLPDRGPRPRTTAAYCIGLILAQAISILVPLLYLAVVTLLMFGLLRFATSRLFLDALYYTFHRWDGNAATALQFYYHRRSPVFLFWCLLLLALGAAVLLVLFLLTKPVWAHRSKRENALALKAELQPVLFAFIEKICGTIGVPMPRRIEVDCQPNAVVDFNRGLRRDDLVLRIGLPLAAGLSVRQFAGVLAHELGHFSQGFGLRQAYIIRELNDWMERAIRERDSLDFWLDEFRSDQMNPFTFWPASAAGVLMDFSRRVFQLVSVVTRICSGFLLRQMEFDADRFEINIAGSAIFASTLRRLASLAEAHERAYRAAKARWNLGRHLPDDFPAYVIFQQSKHSPVRLRTRPEKAKLLRIHPLDIERIQRANQAAEPGARFLEAPASVLFADFAMVARQASYFYYTENLGMRAESSNLQPTESFG